MIRVRIGMVQHPIDMLGGASRAKSCLDPKLKRYAVARETDVARQEFARALRKWVEETHRNTTAFAELIGIKRLAIYQWYRGFSMPSPENLKRLLAAGFEHPLTRVERSTIGGREPMALVLGADVTP